MIERERGLLSDSIARHPDPALMRDNIADAGARVQRDAVAARRAFIHQRAKLVGVIIAQNHARKKVSFVQVGIPDAPAMAGFGRDPLQPVEQGLAHRRQFDAGDVGQHGR
ncbi:hypothetical protein JAGODDHD_02357 [Sphingomonas paucimobilis]|nr:hypothetical protein [Sphingomonas paucimobilis]MDG5971605.1 hypothetical protein [Sphingomonas paucimobilis]